MKRVYLEITNACNLNCPFCTYEKGSDFLSLEEIDDYTSQIKKHCDYIYLHILGEPLLHPKFNEILDILDQKKLKLQLVTNGTLLDEYPDILKHECLRKLSISVHSVNNVVVDERYFECINNLIAENINTKLELRFYGEDTLSDKLSNYLDELKSKYNFSTTAKANSYRLKENTYIYFEDFFKWPDINDPYISNLGKCRAAIDMIAINSKHELTICCLDPKSYNRIGNLKDNSLDELLNSDLYKKYCEDIKNGKLSSDLCSKCTYRLRF